MRRSILSGAVGIGLLFGVIAASADEQRMVRIGISDDTETRRIPKEAELWLKGSGSVWLHRKCERLKDGSLSCAPLDLGKRPVGQVLELYVYADGRKEDEYGFETGELWVPLKITTGMCAAGCARDMITVTISDTTIEVDGTPLQAAGLEHAFKAKRN